MGKFEFQESWVRRLAVRERNQNAPNDAEMIIILQFILLVGTGIACDNEGYDMPVRSVGWDAIELKESPVELRKFGGGLREIEGSDVVGVRIFQVFPSTERPRAG